MWSLADPDAEKSKYHKVGKTRWALLKIRILNVQYCVGTGISAKKLYRIITLKNILTIAKTLSSSSSKDNSGKTYKLIGHFYVANTYNRLLGRQLAAEFRNFLKRWVSRIEWLTDRVKVTPFSPPVVTAS